MLDGEFREGSEGFGFWRLGFGWKVLFWRGTVVNGPLFHVEQFEIGGKDEGFGYFLTVRSTVGRVNFTVAALLITVVSCLTLTEGKSSVTNLLVDRRVQQDLSERFERVCRDLRCGGSFDCASRKVRETLRSG